MKKCCAFIVSFILLASMPILAGTADMQKNGTSKNKKNGGEQVLRAAAGKFDLQRNRISNLDFFATNYGIFAHDVASGRGGGVWPRGSVNQYIFAGGIWVATLKRLQPNDTGLQKLCLITYNPNSGVSWCVPGRIEDGDGGGDEADAIAKYRTYFSTDFTSGGEPFVATDGPNWPIWDTSPNPLDTLKKDRWLGRYVDDITTRNLTTYPKGPAFISQEDVFSTFKDTDLNRYEGGAVTRKAQGYPLRLQFENIVYSWGFGDYADFVFLKYDIINMSKDTLYETWLAPAYDMDIALMTNSQSGAANDRTRYYAEDDTLNLAVQWTNGNQGERGRGFGYIGFDFLESPAVDKQTGTIRRDKKFYANNEQLGLKTFRNWTIDVDPPDNVTRYDFIAAGVKDGDSEAGDKRFLMATGPFTFLPGDTARTVVGIIFAMPAKGGDADGTTEDLAEMVRKDKFAQQVYDNNFDAPKPPDECNLTYRPLNNAIMLQWDNVSEMSNDRREGGLDFLGYKIYRARRDDLDSFDVDQRPHAGLQGRGPLGWKQVTQYTLPTPFLKSLIPSSSVYGAAKFDSVRLVRQIDSVTWEVERFANFADISEPLGVKPWNDYYRSLTPTEFSALLKGTITINIAKDTVLPKWKDKGTIIPNWPAVQSGGSVVRIPWSPNLNTPAKNLTNAADSALYYQVMGRMSALLAKGAATMSFTSIDNAATEEKIRRDVISPYMDSITNHRTFIDLGDDNGDGIIRNDPDPTQTERILNNIDYYYRVRAYDEGDYKILTPSKLNNGVEDKNQVKAYALSGPPLLGGTAHVEITSTDKDKLGGLYNFRFNIKDNQRLNQLFVTNGVGHDLELEFQPYWWSFPYPLPSTQTPKPPMYGMYSVEMTLRDKTSNSELFRGTSMLEPNLCYYGYATINLFSENGARWIMADSAVIDPLTGKLNTIGKADDTSKTVRKGSFTTYSDGSNASCYTALMGGAARQTLDFSFDYAIQQQGGLFRPLRSEIIQANSGANAILNFDANSVQTTQNVDTVSVGNGYVRYVQGSFNNGPAIYDVEFLPGGIMPVTLTYENGSTTKTFNVPYLEVKVHNSAIYQRPSDDGKGIADVTYPGETAHYTVNPLAAQELPDQKVVAIGQFNLSSVAFVNGRSKDGFADRRKQAARGTNVQGRYLLSAIDGADTVDFVNVFTASGMRFVSDYSNKSGYDQSKGVWPQQDFATYGQRLRNGEIKDFQAGDKIRFSVTGGALGFPLPGAKVNAKVVPSGATIEQMTDELLDQILVVPNPYYVSHQGQRSPNDAKIYFTNLPSKCTIKIFTVNGDLVRTMQHDELTSPEPNKYSMEIWDLLSKNRQRVSSQTLIAQIETPNGAKVLKPFTVIIGGARLIPE